jgi:hypothetical protein
MSSVSPDDRSTSEKRMNINTALAILARVHTRTDPVGGLFVEFGAQPDGIVPLPLYVAAWRRVSEHVAEHSQPDDQPRRCPHCHGLGHYLMPRREGPDLYSLTQLEEVTCPACQGTGIG